MNARDRELLLEAATTAHRPVDASGRWRASPAWHDLTAADREVLHRQLEVQRAIEAAMDPQGLSSTARAVLRRVTLP
jgi:hypothetical protein